MGKTEEKTKKQHYVPRSYLKRFTDRETGTFYTYDIEKKEYDCIKTPESIMYEDYFYEAYPENPDNRVEKAFRPYERKWNRIFNKILRHGCPKAMALCIGKYADVLAEFCIFQHLRVSKGIEALKPVVRDIVDCLKDGTTLLVTDEELDKLKSLSKLDSSKIYITQDYLNYFENNDYSPKIALIELIETSAKHFRANATIYEINILFGETFWTTNMPALVLYNKGEEPDWELRFVMSPYVAIIMKAKEFKSSRSKPKNRTVNWYVLEEGLSLSRFAFMYETSSVILSMQDFTENDRETIEKICGVKSTRTSITDLCPTRTEEMQERRVRVPKKRKKVRKILEGEDVIKPYIRRYIRYRKQTGSITT